MGHHFGGADGDSVHMPTQQRQHGWVTALKRDVIELNTRLFTHCGSGQVPDRANPRIAYLDAAGHSFGCGQKFLYRVPGRISFDADGRGKGIKTRHRNKVVLADLANAHMRDDQNLCRQHRNLVAVRRCACHVRKANRASRPWLVVDDERLRHVFFGCFGKRARHRVRSTASCPRHHQLNWPFWVTSDLRLRGYGCAGSQRQCAKQF